MQQLLECVGLCNQQNLTIKEKVFNKETSSIKITKQFKYHTQLFTNSLQIN